MARYRVVKRLPWIEGGEPGTDADGKRTWIGGAAMIYEPGVEVEVQDHEVRGGYEYLEAIDDEGRAALKCIRAEASRAPAENSWGLDDFPPPVAAAMRLYADLDKLGRGLHAEVLHELTQRMEAEQTPSKAGRARALQRRSLRERRWEAVGELLADSEEELSGAQLAIRLAAAKRFDDDVRYRDPKNKIRWSSSLMRADRKHVCDMDEASASTR